MLFPILVPGIVTDQMQCDEKRPVCGNCQKHFVNVVECDYAQNVSQRSRKSTPQISNWSEDPQGEDSRARLNTISPLSRSIASEALDPFETHPASSSTEPDITRLMEHCKYKSFKGVPFYVDFKLT